MTGLFETLTTQHKNIHKLVTLIEKEIDRVDDGEMPNIELMADMMQYLIRYVDVAHHPLEETLMSIYESETDSTDESVATCKAQHKQILALGQTFSAVIEGVREEQLVERQQFVEAGRDYVETQMEHMNLEEGKVFPVLRAALSDEQIKQADSEISSSRDPLFGAIVEDEYQKLYDYIIRSA